MNVGTIASLLDLKGTSSLVTGGGQGIGEAICRRLADAGSNVGVVDIDQANAERVAAHIRESGGKAIALRCDVGQPAQAEAAVEAVAKEFGGLDILVNNAGIFPFSPVSSTTPELWNRVLAVNLSGAFYLAKAALGHMNRPDHPGAIVNIASVDAFRPTGNLAHYDASKGGMVMLTRALALECGRRGVRVNCVAPGSIVTPGAQAASGAAMPAGTDVQAVARAFLARIPLGRMGEPDDVANAVLFLASRAANYVSGATLVVDGGYLVG